MLMPILAREFVAVAVSIVLGIIYLFIEPRLKYYWRLMVDICILTSITTIGASAIIMFFKTDDFSSSSIGGAHLYTYILILIVYLIAFMKSYDGLFSFILAALYVSLHEGLWYVVFYASLPNRLIGPLTADRAFLLWMGTIIFLYLWKKYPKSNTLILGSGIYFVFYIIATLHYGIGAVYNNFTVHFIGWTFMAVIFIIHLWRMKWNGRGYISNIFADVHH